MSSSNSGSFFSIPSHLVLQIAAYLPARDLLQFQCVSNEIAYLDTDKLWQGLCEKRWKPWPRYRLTGRRLNELNNNVLSSTSSWKDHYRTVEVEATRMTLRNSDLFNLKWYLSFALSGVRGESRTEFMPVQFLADVLMVPGYPPLRYELVSETPPSSSSHIRTSQRGDQPFSTEQWLRISTFPPHFITRRRSNAEWLIVNENVMFVSCKKD